MIHAKCGRTTKAGQSQSQSLGRRRADPPCDDPPVRRFEQLRGMDQVLALIRDLRGKGRSAAGVAEQLNAAGWRPPKRDGFNASMVQRLVFRHGLGSGRPILSSNVAHTPGAEWTLQEAAQRLGVHQATVYRWLRGGRLRGRMAKRGEQRIWLIQMSSEELDQVRTAANPACARNPVGRGSMETQSSRRRSRKTRCGVRPKSAAGRPTRAACRRPATCSCSPACRRRAVPRRRWPTSTACAGGSNCSSSAGKAWAAWPACAPRTPTSPGPGSLPG